MNIFSRKIQDKKYSILVLSAVLMTFISLKVFAVSKQYTERVGTLFQEELRRQPTKAEFDHFGSLLEKGELDEGGLRIFLRTPEVQRTRSQVPTPRGGPEENEPWIGTEVMKSRLGRYQLIQGTVRTMDSKHTIYKEEPVVMRLDTTSGKAWFLLKDSVDAAKWVRVEE